MVFLFLPYKLWKGSCLKRYRHINFEIKMLWIHFMRENAAVCICIATFPATEIEVHCFRIGGQVYWFRWEVLEVEAIVVAHAWVPIICKKRSIPVAAFFFFYQPATVADQFFWLAWLFGLYCGTAVAFIGDCCITEHYYHIIVCSIFGTRSECSTLQILPLWMTELAIVYVVG